MSDQKTILLIEDDNFLSGMYETKLKLEGFNVLVAGDGAKGLEYATTKKPDIILLDIILPKMDGFTVLKHLSDSGDIKKIPVILMTNLGQKEDIEKGMSLGARDYLVKAHFMPSEVVTKIRQYLGDAKTA
ncbi:MAG TPA: response regulator [Patescibacteria group bacterium]|nr:response regulator [Patescibacteria group bacterium]